MISLQEAQERVLAGCAPLPVEEVSLSQAFGRVLARPVVAPGPVPPFDNSSMDGYAVRAEDVEGATGTDPSRLTVIATARAGARPGAVVGARQAVRIMTGAPFPEGADSVAIVETTAVEGEEVLVFSPTRPGDFVRAAGGDLVAGQAVFGAGEVLGPGHLGVLASCGLGHVPVGGRPVVGVLSTGDELVEPFGRLEPGQVRDSNRYILLGLLERDGYRSLDLGIGRDDEVDIAGRLGEGARSCDAIVTSGGVSVGDFDFVRKVLAELGDMEWMQIAIRPGKPFVFGRIGVVPVFGLAGNPVSTMVSYELLARPGLRRMGGHGEGDLFRPLRAGVAADESLHRRPDGRVHYARVVARPGGSGQLEVSSAGGQESNMLFPMARANALAVLPDGSGVCEGEQVEVMLVG